MKPSIPHSRPTLGRAEQRAAARVIGSGQLAAGREVARLEAEFAVELGFDHVVAVASGTAALHLTLLALEAGPGTPIVAPSYTCTAVLNAIRYVGGAEQLVDVARDGFNLDPGRLAPGARLAIVPHTFGYPAPIEALVRAGLDVIEDCAMAAGATEPSGRPLGQRGRAAIYSLYATKPLAAGEGGLVATNDPDLAAEVRDRREYDKRPDWRLRFNYKLTDLHAALARCQLRRLAAATARRRELAARYDRLLAGAPVIRPPLVEGASYFRYVVRTDDPAAAKLVFAAAGIEVARPVYRPLHSLLGLAADAFPQTERLFLTAVSLPIYPTLARRAQQSIAAVAQRL